MNKLAFVHTPLSDKLLFRSLHGREALSSLFHYSVEMVSLDDNIDLNSLLGQSISIQVKQLHAPDHWLNGDIISMELIGKEGGSSRYYVYKAEVYPRLWYLSQNKDFRIFQEQSVPDIIKQVLADYNIAVNNSIFGDYRKWNYCVQYNESSLDFISRLMEHEGIYYYFTHQQGQHTLVLADCPESHQPIAYPLIPYRGPEASALADEICIDKWQVSSFVTASKVSMDDYNFHKPYARLFDSRNNAASHALENTEVFEWPGRFIDREHAQAYNEIRKQEQAAHQQKMVGSATTCMTTPGGKMTVIKSARREDNKEYLIIESTYSVWDNTYASGTDAKRGQASDFYAIPSSIPWRPARNTPWPKTQGPQTARVVCPEGETIWTDKYGRVKVKFHWDRYAKGDDTSSCWIRVASSWAGQGYGGVQIPRLNDEVVVDFINGDPDRPIIIGRVYNEANMPPWELPANATQMGFFSRSKGGNKGTANALRFEDKMGEEQVWLEAQKNMDINVKNDETHTTGANRTKTIIGDETVTVKSNRTETVDINETITIHGTRTETVDGDETITLNSNRNSTIGIDSTSSIGGNDTQTVRGDRTVTINGNLTSGVIGNESRTVNGDYDNNITGTKNETVGKSVILVYQQDVDQTVTTNKTTTIGGDEKETVIGSQTSNITANHSITVTGDQSFTVAGSQTHNITGDVTIVSASKITLLCGASSIIMDASGNISITGVNITSTASTAHNINGSSVTSSATGDNVVEGATLKLNP